MREFQSIADQKMSTMVTRHPWRSPVPYLFGGLAAMLGLIAFALLLLACSYWTISGRTNSGDSAGDTEKQTESGEKVAAKVFEEKILVIMAGQNKPTFLATPVAAKTCVTRVDCVISGEIVVNTENKEGQNGESKVTEGSSFSSDEENQ
uniref:Protein GLUTAMINE DUMPER 5 n=1 Tax=Noccaea caerulescens TaxID=107243 RepID=A0A1J3DKV7_NOCCA